MKVKYMRLCKCRMINRHKKTFGCSPINLYVVYFNMQSHDQKIPPFNYKRKHEFMGLDMNTSFLSFIPAFLL